MRTRRGNKEVNIKTKKMCEALTKAENAKALPQIEGELPDMPEGSADEDFEETSERGRRSGKGKKKGAKKGQTAPELNEAEIEKVKKESNSLFNKFNMAEKLDEIEKAEKVEDFDKIIEFSSKLSFLFKLMEDFRKEGKRVLIFSMSKKMLTVIENIIQKEHFGKGKFKHIRIDGDTEISSRE